MSGGSVREHEQEPILGLPEMLPEGERLLWQGAPDFILLARRALHINKIVVWFIAIALWRVGSAWQQTNVLTIELIWTPLLALVLALALLLTMARLYARSTMYTLTNRRVVMRFGLAVPITMNIPFSEILSADTSAFSKDRGNIAFTVKSGVRVSQLVLWPNVRPWHWVSPKPMLCCINDFSAASEVLLSAVIAGQPDQTPETSLPTHGIQGA